MIRCKTEDDATIYLWLSNKQIFGFKTSMATTGVKFKGFTCRRHPADEGVVMTTQLLNIQSIFKCLC